jgi:hypothetical protein
LFFLRVYLPNKALTPIQYTRQQSYLGQFAVAPSTPNLELSLHADQSFAISLVTQRHE